MKVPLFFSLVLCLTAVPLSAAVTVVSPASDAEVSLLKPAIREYLSQNRSTRHDRLVNAADRRKMAQCGNRPESVALVWKDDAFAANAAYLVTVGVKGTKADVFTVSNKTEVALVNLETGRIYEWSVARIGADGAASSHFRTAAGVRPIFIPGVRNCRDLGGVPTRGGKRVKQGQILRTAAYNSASTRSGDSLFDMRYTPGVVRITRGGRRELCGTFGVKTDLDLRNEAETAGMTASPLGKEVAWAHVPIRAYEWLENDRRALAEALRPCLDAKRRPLAFHCAGGRDRGGSLAFILGGLLGVDEETLRKDWELSAFETDDLGVTPARLEGLLEMLKHYPGDDVNARIENFVRQCGIAAEAIARFREEMTE